MVSPPTEQAQNELIARWLRLLDIVHAVVYAHSVYHYGVTSFMNPFAMLRPTWYVTAGFNGDRFPDTFCNAGVYQYVRRINTEMQYD